jgi:hypothetical protein
VKETIIKFARGKEPKEWRFKGMGFKGMEVKEKGVKQKGIKGKRHCR